MELNVKSVQGYKDSGAGVIVLAAPEKGNVLNPGMLSALTGILENYREDDEVRFVILRSTGSTFCLGMDLAALLASQGRDEEALRDAVGSYANVLTALDAFPKPTLAVVQGSVKAGGVGLMAACDIVVATTEASFELSEILWGLLPANVLPTLISQRIPAKKAGYLVLTAAVIDSDEALRIGLVDKQTSPEELSKTLRSLGRQLVRTAPGATQRYKALAADLQHLPLEDRGRRAIDEIVSLATDPTALAAIKAFKDGDMPSWFARFKPSQSLIGED